MPTLSLAKKDLPFLLRGKGEVAIDTGDLKLRQPIPEGSSTVFSVAFKAGGEQKVTLGQDDSVKLGVSTTASIKMEPLFSSSRRRRRVELSAWRYQRLRVSR